MSETTLPAGAARPGKPHNHPFKITIRTLAGHSLKDTVKPNDRVSEVTARAVKHFVAKRQLAPGDYALTLPRTCGETELDPTAALDDACIEEGGVARGSTGQEAAQVPRATGTREPDPLNPTPDSKWDASPKSVEREFVRRVREQGVECTMRDTRGQEIAPACGQLTAQGDDAPLCSLP